MARATAAVVGVLLLSLSATASAQSLRGSRATMREQNSVARKHDYSFLRTSSQVKRFVGLGLLVELRGNADYELARVSYPYARPAVKTFVERLASQYHAACGERLVVTSLTRPEARQPRNASELSVHPAGMAVDLRVSRRSQCRKWLESTLLSLEDRDVLDVTRERYPPHYHVAVFPNPYDRYVDALNSRARARLAAAEPASASEATAVAVKDAPAKQATSEAVATLAVADEPSSGDAPVTAASTRATGQPAGNTATVEAYEVRPGDTLWGIARRFGVTVDALKAANDLGGARIMAGQTLTVARAAAAAPSAAGDAAATVVAAASMPSAQGGPSEPASAGASTQPTVIRYEVRPGDTLWDIARSHGITVEELKTANGLSTARITAGQTLALPTP